MGQHPNQLKNDRNRRYRAAHAEELRLKERARNAERADYKGDYQRANKRIRPFVGVDGEGRNLPNGYHAYFMLRAGESNLTTRSVHSRIRPGSRIHNNTDARLRSVDMLDFLSQLSPENEYVAFFFDYDVTKILEDLPFARLERLINRKQRLRQKGGYFPLNWGEYSLEYFPRKELKVKKGDGPWITINDVGSFFQCPFIDALIKWGIGTPEQQRMIAAGKALRAYFADLSEDEITDEIEALLLHYRAMCVQNDLYVPKWYGPLTDDEIDAYNALECVLLADLMEQFRAVCDKIGYVPRKWQGPGQLAEAAMRKHNIPKTKDLRVFDDVSPDSVGAFARYAFYGGWFETTLVGYTPVPCAQFDLNGAFPWGLTQVPCLEHGEWERNTGKRELGIGELSICFGHFKWPRESKRAMLMGLPVRRKDGSVHHPMDGKGWYWSFEIRSAIHQRFTVYDSWIYKRHCRCVPFGFLNDLYEQRKVLGKSTVGLMVKLLMNSMSGKVQQSIGFPKYSNPIWASFLIAIVRTRIAEAIHSLPACKDPNRRHPCGTDVYMVASDAIFTRDYDDTTLDIGSALGQFERDRHDNGLFIIQPGVYFDPIGDNDRTVFKTRGVPKRMVIEYRQQFLDNFKVLVETRKLREADVHLPFHLFVGIRQALHRHNMRQLGQMVPYKDPDTGQMGRRTSFDWKTKRRPQPLPDMFGRMGGDIWSIRTIPYFGTVDETVDGRPIQTVPYSRDIGGLIANELRRLDFEDQPDWIGTT